MTEYVGITLLLLSSVLVLGPAFGCGGSVLTCATAAFGFGFSSSLSGLVFALLKSSFPVALGFGLAASSFGFEGSSSFFLRSAVDLVGAAITRADPRNGFTYGLDDF